MAVIGLDLGGTKLAGAVFSDAGDILHKRFLPLENRRGMEVGALIRTMILDLLRSADEEGRQVRAVGACVPGIAYSKTGKVWAPNIPGWEDYPLLDEMRTAVEGRDIVAGIDSDRACYILGEVWKGAAQGCRDAIFLAVGTGIGAGILVNGQILRGAHDVGGAIGWLALDRPFHEKYVDCGCFEYHASGPGLVRVAREMMGADQAYSGALTSKAVEALTAKDVFEACFDGDPIAMAVIDQAIEFWGMTAANLVSLFNPEKIIFGGGVFGPALQYLERIYEESKKWAQPISINQVRLEGSMLGGDAGLYGAGFLAMIE
jgi:glucokinase